MKFSINASVFASVLKQCARVASRKGGTAETHVLIGVEANELTLIAQNGSQQIIRRVRTSSLVVEAQGHICAAAQKMEQIVSAMPGDRDVKVSLSDEKLVITCARSRFSLATMNVDSFPLIKVSTPVAEFKVNAANLRDSGKSVAVCCAREDVRQYLNGMLLDVREGTLYLAASDGHRMGVCRIEGVTGSDSQAIIPVASVDDFLTFATESEACIRLYPNLAVVVSDAGEFYTKLLEGKYPDYQRLLKKPSSPSTLKANRPALLASAQRVALMADQRSFGIKFNLGREITLTTAASDIEGNAASEVIDGQYIGSDMEVGFSARYLTDILKTVTAEEVEIVFDGATGGTHLSPTDCAQQSFVLMPMRI